jgi:hypothetical protein
MVVLQTGLHYRAVISEASRVFCCHMFTLVAAIQNEEDFKHGLVRVYVYKCSSVHVSIFKYTTDDTECRSRSLRIWKVRDQNLTAVLFTYILCGFPKFVQEKDG